MDKENRADYTAPETTYEQANGVPYIAFESAMARMERTVKRLFILVMTSILLLLVTNIAWLWSWSQYDYCSESYSYEQDGEGLNLIGDRNNLNGTTIFDNPADEETERREIPWDSETP